MIKPNLNLLFSINIILFVCGIAIAFSGFTIMFQYHMGHSGDINTTDKFWGLNYFNWSGIHKFFAVVLSLLMSYHFLLHWKWFKTVLLKKLLAKNWQVIVLSIIFSIAFLTGFIPWLLQLGDNIDFDRRIILEIHDKIGLILIVYLVLHVSKRFKWFISTYAKLN